MNFFKISLAFFFLTLFYCCGSNDKNKITEQEENRNTVKSEPEKEKIILVFIDFEGGEDYIKSTSKSRKKIGDLINGICNSKTDKNIPFVLKVFPLYINTGNGEPIFQFNYNGQPSGGDLFCDNLYNDYELLSFNAISSFSKKYNDQSPICKIIESLDVLRVQIAGIDIDKEDIYMIYLSDMLERHSPTDETIGQFNFLKDGRNEINEYSLIAANNQLEDPDTYIGKKIEHFKQSLPDIGALAIKVFVMPLNNNKIEIVSGKANYSNVIEFWQNFFRKSGLKYIQLDEGMDENTLIRRVFN